jgi:ATP synthase protein I
MSSPREPSPWRALGDLAHVGMTLVIATVLGLVSGYLIDRWLGSDPWLTLVGLGLGIAAGFVNFFRTIAREGRDRNGTA